MTYSGIEEVLARTSLPKGWIAFTVLFSMISGCVSAPTETQPLPSSDPMLDLVPFIDCPDFDVAYSGFGFNLPPDWRVAWDDSAQAINITRPPYRLTVYIRPDREARETLARIGTLVGRIEIHGFWNDTVLDKFWLVSTADRPVMIVYFAQGPLDNSWLTAYLECLGESCTKYIPDEIEAQVDWLLTSYEEHGWEE